MNAQEAHLQMWAGLECTLNRVKDKWINQEDKNDHHKRLHDDIKLFAGLGVSKIRYPCLWEVAAPNDPEHFEWESLDLRLSELKRLNVDIIATFLHHGSGPHYTSLIDESLPEKLSSYAKAFIERYAWVEDFTPINEINTTTRFSLLYGHWYPHHKYNHQGYVRSLFLQVKATILCMQEIRKVNPRARLIQTDDLGKCQATEPLKDQADFENHRRWLSWDMLCGKIDKDHPIYDYLSQNGLSDDEMLWLKTNACPPDVVGINHYHLSNRFLDHRFDLYPKEFLVNDYDHPFYADVGAIHTSDAEYIPSIGSLIEETWNRYKLPVAVTEVHVMGDRSSQMRWLYEVWKSAKELHEKDVGIVAVTVWSLLGTYDWNKLCTTWELFYEPGVFDLRTPGKKPRKTALSRLVQNLARTGDDDHPILKEEGWWKNNRRLHYVNHTALFSPLSSSNERAILITGRGKLGYAFAKCCGERNISYKWLGRDVLDITNIDNVRKILRELKPWAIINTAGFADPDRAELETQRCFSENVFGPLNLSIASEELGIPLVHFSSDLVFDGSKQSPYIERDLVSPSNIFGVSKVQSENVVLNYNPKSLVIRSSSFFGADNDQSSIRRVLTKLLKQDEILMAKDSYLTPTYVPDLTEATLDLLLDQVTGIVHLTNKGHMSWVELAELTSKMLSCKYSTSEKKVSSIAMKDRKNYSLVSESYDVLPSIENALDRYLSKLLI